MSEREANEDLEPMAEGTGASSKLKNDDAPGIGDSKVINKGKAKLIITGVDETQKEADETQVIPVEPRVVKASKPLPEVEPEVEAEEIQRLERNINPGKERIKVDTANFENREIRPDEAEIQEAQWGEGITPGWWVVITGACAAVLLLGGLAIESWINGDQAQIIPTPQPRAVVDVDPYEGSPEKWFHERFGEKSDKLNNLLKAFIDEEEIIAQSKFVRNPESYINKVREWDVKVSPRLGVREEQLVSIEITEDTAFMVLVCKDTNFMPFRAYFVREGDGLKFDWEATTAWSEVSFETIKNSLNAQYNARKKTAALQKQKIERQQQRKREEILKKAQTSENIVHIVKPGESLAVLSKRYKISVDELIRLNQLPNTTILVGQKLNISTGVIQAVEPSVIIPQQSGPSVPDISQEELYTEPLLVRCLMSRRDEFYAGPYNDLEHSAFILLSPDKSNYLWAYTARDSALDIELRRLLDHGRFVVALKKNIHVTLRIRRNQKDALPSQVELVEIVHPEWVTP